MNHPFIESMNRKPLTLPADNKPTPAQRLFFLIGLILSFAIAAAMGYAAASFLGFPGT